MSNDQWTEADARAIHPTARASAAAVDPFAADRAQLQRAYDDLRATEATVTLGEWVADNMLGDPELREAMHLAEQARSCLVACETLIRLALDALPKPVTS